MTTNNTQPTYMGKPAFSYIHHLEKTNSELIDQNYKLLSALERLRDGCIEDGLRCAPDSVLIHVADEVIEEARTS